MIKLELNPVKFRFVNPSKQLNTSGFAVFKDSLNLSQSVEPKYCKECTHVYEDTDMMFSDYDPLKVESPSSAQSAQNFNESVNSQTYGKTA